MFHDSLKYGQDHNEESAVVRIAAIDAYVSFAIDNAADEELAKDLAGPLPVVRNVSMNDPHCKARSLTRFGASNVRATRKIHRGETHFD